MPLGSLQDAATSTLPDGEGCVARSRWRWTPSSSGGRAVGRITRRGKSARKPLAGNPHERFEVAGAGNGPGVLGTAPALDPTTGPLVPSRVSFTSRLLRCTFECVTAGKVVYLSCYL